MSDEQDKIQLQHPEGKSMLRIDSSKYELIHAEIIKVLSEQKQMQPMQLLNEVGERLKGKMEGSITWYAESVKLDMEAKDELTHDRKTRIVKLKERE